MTETAPERVSPCQPYNALVNTPAGMVPIGELVEQRAVGAKVYDAYGVTKVVGTRANGVRDVLRIHTMTGHALDVTADHEVWCVDGAGRQEAGGQFVPAGELRVGHQLEWYRRTSYGEQEIILEQVSAATAAGRPGSANFTGECVPSELFIAPLPVVAAYLRSLFGDEGYVSTRDQRIVLAIDLESEELVRGVQSLLARFGIFAQIAVAVSAATPTGWSLRVHNGADRLIFADEIGIDDPVRTAELEAAFELSDLGSRDIERVIISGIEYRGPMPVFDIQTESGEYLSGNLRVHNCRRDLRRQRRSVTVSFTVGGAEGYLTAGLYPDDGLGEIFVRMSKQGSTLAGVMDAFSVAVSIALRQGVPLETYVSQFVNTRFEPTGVTDDPDIRMATSVVDYLFRRIALDYLPRATCEQLGVLGASAEKRPQRVPTDEVGDKRAAG